MRHMSAATGIALVAASLFAFAAIFLGREHGQPAEAAVSAPPSGEIAVAAGAGLPDLTIPQINLALTGPSCAPTFYLEVHVSNGGDAAAGTFVVDVGGVQQTVTSLAPFTTTVLSFPAVGFAVATADIFDTVTESNEGNNTAFVPPPVSMTPAPTCTPSVPTNTPTPSPTGGNPDGDGIPNGADNCPADFNPGQENNDGNFIAASTPLPVDDLSRARSDTPGDACDDDDDNDDLIDTAELAAQCDGYTTDPMEGDTDHDGVTDLIECMFDNDPTDATNKPAAAMCAMQIGSALGQDRDGDRIRDSAEFCGYGTNHFQLDSDGDGVHDGCEAVSLNGDQVVNAGDQLLLAFGILGDLNGPPNGNADINKDGAVNSGDQLMMATVIMPTAQCPSGGPDLIVEAVWIELETSGGCYMSTTLGTRARIRNQGAVAAGTFVVSINNIQRTIAGLAPGATAVAWVPGYANPALESASVDVTSLVSETDDLNNGPFYQFAPIPTLPPACTSTPTATATPTPVVNTFTNTGSASTGYASFGYASYGVFPLSPAGSVTANAPGCGTPTVLALRDFSLRLFVSVEWPTQCLDPGESFTVSLEPPTAPAVPSGLSALWIGPVKAADLVNPGGASSYVVVSYNMAAPASHLHELVVTDPPGCSGASITQDFGPPPPAPFPVQEYVAYIEYPSTCIDPGETLSIAFDPPIIENPIADFSQPPPTATPTPTNTPSLPDLRIYFMHISIEQTGACYVPPHGTLGVRAVVQNQGGTAAGPFVVTINSTPVNVAGLAPGAFATPWVSARNYPGAEHAFADSTLLVVESNEGNNQMSQPLPIPTLPLECTSTPTATPTP